VLPGTYTARLTKGGAVYESKFEIGLDRRATFSLADRKGQFDAAMRVHKLFGAESAVIDRIGRARAEVEAATANVPDPGLKTRLAAFDAQLDEVRKRIVATKEGGAITGEERLREHTDNLYGAIMSYEGAPGAYQLERIGVLEVDLADIDGALEKLLTSELPALNDALQKSGQPPIPSPPRIAAARDSGISSANARWLGSRERGDEKELFHSLPQGTVSLR
jgi:hypothetical protein